MSGQFAEGVPDFLVVVCVEAFEAFSVVGCWPTIAKVTAATVAGRISMRMRQLRSKSLLIKPRMPRFVPECVSASQRPLRLGVKFHQLNIDCELAPRRRER